MNEVVHKILIIKLGNTESKEFSIKYSEFMKGNSALKGVLLAHRLGVQVLTVCPRYIVQRLWTQLLYLISGRIIASRGWTHTDS
jgi:hypothetical protein